MAAMPASMAHIYLFDRVRLRFFQKPTHYSAPTSRLGGPQRSASLKYFSGAPRENARFSYIPRNSRQPAQSPNLYRRKEFTVETSPTDAGSDTVSRIFRV